MKLMLSQILSLMICLELVLAPFPKQARADTIKVEDKTSFSELARSNESNDQNLFGDQGIAKVPVDPKTGKVILNATGGVDIGCTDITSDKGVHADPGEPTSINCPSAVKSAVATSAFTEKAAKEALSQKSSSSRNTNCATPGCVDNEQNDRLSQVKNSCSPEIKKQVLELEKNDKNCSPEKLVRKAADEAYNNSSTGSHVKTCWNDFWTALWASLKQPFKDGWNAGKATFASTRKADDEVTKRMQLFMKLPAKEVQKGVKNSNDLSESIKDKVIGALASIMNGIKNVDSFTLGAAVGGATTVASEAGSFFTGLNVKEQFQIYNCADCDHKLEVTCKLLSRIGFDAVTFGVIAIATGGAVGAIKGRGAIRSAVRKTFGRESDLIALNLAKDSETKAVEFAGHVQPVLTQDAERVAANAAKLGTPENIARQLENKKLNFVPASKDASTTVVKVSGGDKTKLLVADTSKNQTSLAKVEGLELPKNSGVQPLEQVTAESKSTLLVGSDRPETPPMTEAKKFVAKIKGSSGERLPTAGIHNATPVAFEVAEDGQVKTIGQDLRVNSLRDKNPSPVKSIHTYGSFAEGEKPNFIVEKQDGRVAFMRYAPQKDGSSMYVIEKEFSAREAKSVKALIDPIELDKANQILLDRTKANAELNGIKTDLVASSGEDGSANKVVEAQVPPNENCPLGAKVLLGK